MEFLSSDVLNQKFYTEGAFYHIEMNGKNYQCRGLARICRRNALAQTADAIVVMVNPGSSQPIDKDYVFPLSQDNIRKIPMVPARSDQTQHQLMRLMEFRGWNLIYIINLSDLRTGSLSEFHALLKEFTEQGNQEHSIFSAKRREQINTLRSNHTKIIVGWGVQEQMKAQMREAIEVLEAETKIYGIPHRTQPFYLHPKPALIEKQKDWLKKMNEMLDSDPQPRKEDISTLIVRDIIRDIQGRIGLEDEFRGLHPAEQIEIYEKWIEIVSKRMYQEGLIEEKYIPFNADGLSLGEVVNRNVHYMGAD